MMLRFAGIMLTFLSINTIFFYYALHFGTQDDLIHIVFLFETIHLNNLITNTTRDAISHQKHAKLSGLANRCYKVT